jgi:tetratricopeptide (TPR) repeat protein
MKQASWVFFFICFFYLPSLQAKTDCPNKLPAPNLINQTRALFEQTLQTDHPGQRITLVNQGLDWSNRCVGVLPQEAACYYYRALFRALHTKQNFFGYQKALVKIIKDLDDSLKLDPHFDEAGAIRTKGFIYLKAPQFSTKKKSVVKNLDLATTFADQALKLYPKNRENRLLFASVQFEQQNYEVAAPHLKSLQKEYKDLTSPNHQEQEDQKSVNSMLNKMAKLESKD